jgi:hypothetical protein
VQDIRTQFERPGQRQHCPAKYDESVEIVRVAVHAVTTHEQRFFDQVDRHRLEAALPNTAAQRSALRSRNRHINCKSLQPVPNWIDAGVTGQDQSGVQPQPGQRRWQGTRYVAESTNLREWRGLSRHEQNLHRRRAAQPSASRLATRTLEWILSAARWRR